MLRIVPSPAIPAPERVNLKILVGAHRTLEDLGDLALLQQDVEHASTFLIEGAGWTDDHLVLLDDMTAGSPSAFHQLTSASSPWAQGGEFYIKIFRLLYGTDKTIRVADTPFGHPRSLDFSKFTSALSAAEGFDGMSDESVYRRDTETYLQNITMMLQDVRERDDYIIADLPHIIDRVCVRYPGLGQSRDIEGLDVLYFLGGDHRQLVEQVMFAYSSLTNGFQATVRELRDSDAEGQLDEAIKNLIREGLEVPLELVGRAMVLNAYLSLLRVKFRGEDIRMTAVVRICENVSEARLPGLYHLIHGAVQSRWKLMQLRRMTQHIF